MIAFFGGRFKVDGKYVYLNELWLYDLATVSWELMDPAGPRPDARDHHGAASLDGELFIFGGRTAFTRGIGAVRGDVWSYSAAVNRWVERDGGGGPRPSPRFMSGVEAVSWRGREALAIFGGEEMGRGKDSTKRSTLNDVWVYDVAARAWEELRSSHCRVSRHGEHLKRKDVRKDRLPRRVWRFLELVDPIATGMQPWLLLCAFFLSALALARRCRARPSGEAGEPAGAFYLMVD